ncbi:hypothetical protein ACWEQL_28490 [Kitasatospora sp. NPDC004240]
MRGRRPRGWPADLHLDLPLEVVTEDGTATEPYTLRIVGGHGELARGSRTPRLTLTRGQFAAWYAGATAAPPRPRWPA